MQVASRLAAASLLVVPALLGAQSSQSGAARSTSSTSTAPAITTADLRTRLSIFADDSMQGRETGKIGNFKGTEYIARELAKLGLRPAGEKGTFFQELPYRDVAVDPAAAMSIDNQGMQLGTDFLVLPSYGPIPFGGSLEGAGVQTVYGGRWGDTTAIDPSQTAGRLVVFSAPTNAQGQAAPQFWGVSGFARRFANAAGIAIATLDITPAQLRSLLAEPRSRVVVPGAPRSQFGMIVTRDAARRILGVALESARAGTAGKPLTIIARFKEATTEAPARNVIAVLEGSDPKLRGQFVAIGAHNDHVGFTEQAVDHDSVRAYNAVIRPEGAEDTPRQPSAEEATRIRGILDSLRATRPARMDSINNGADDDGSGSMAVLEIAEALATARVKPKRSILFVWHTGEEKGLLGSEYFTDVPTVPRDSIVAQLNIDMIGRGTAQDVKNGGPHYVQLVGSRRLSTELGDLVESVNTTGKHGFTFDYQYDANGHPQNIYCRSDHYSYARYGIPVVFFTTGVHRDYHMVTDEVQYIDFDHFRGVTQLIHDIATTVGNRAKAPVVDKPKPDPKGECRQ